MQNPRIGTVLHWPPPNVQIFGTAPSLVISRRALAREGDYEMMPVCACVCACVS